MRARALRLAAPLPRLLGPGEILAGEGALAALRALPAARVALIASARAVSNEAVQRWLHASLAYETRHLAPSWTGEPTIEDLAGTRAALAEWRPDWIVAIGGGSVLDGAKICWALYEHPLFAIERLDHPFALPPLRRLSHFAAVPTTAGTGSEASSSAVFTDAMQGRKRAVVSHDLLPDLAILDPRLTVDQPPALTLLSAMDALGHALEGYTSTLRNPLVDPMAVAAVSDILDALRALAVTPEDLRQRCRLQVAACYAGHVQNLRLVGLAHAIAHQLGGHHVPHALAIATLLPDTMEMTGRDAAVRQSQDELARRVGLSDATALVAELRALPARFGVSARLGSESRTLAPGEAMTIAGKALEDPIARFLPVACQADEIATLVERLW